VTFGSLVAVTLPMVVVLPLSGAAVTAVARGNARARFALIAAVLTTVAVAVLTVAVLTEGMTTLVLSNPVGLELVLVADGLALAMVAMTAVTCSIVAGFAASEDRAHPEARHERFWPVWFGLWASLHLLFLAGDLLTAYLMLEAIGIAGAGLVSLAGDRPTLLAGTRYLYAELVASTTVLAGIALIWSRTGSLRFAELEPGLVTEPGGWLALGVVSAGLLLKVPLAPIHIWLPAAHTRAPSAVSPVLSAVVVKSSFAVLVRLWFVSAPELVTRSAAQLLGALGVVAIVWGSVLALRATHVKELIAYSTVAQLGFLVLLVPLVQAGAADAWRGGLLYAVTHALAKAALLLAAAVLIEDAGQPDIDALLGAASRRPLAVFAVGIGGLSLVGLPPRGGFVGKWYLLAASLQTGQWWWLAPILLGSLLTAGYLLRLLKPAFATDASLHPTTSASPPTGSIPPTPASTPSTTASMLDGRAGLALALALTTIALGIRPTEMLELLDLGAPLLTGGP
jgi:multicomponent Na+:H+ antiporter subunit D